MSAAGSCPWRWTRRASCRGGDGDGRSRSDLGKKRTVMFRCDVCSTKTQSSLISGGTWRSLLCMSSSERGHADQHSFSSHGTF